MKQNKFNLQQMKGYFNDFIYTIELPGVDKYNCHIIYVKIFNLKGINIAEYLIKVNSKRKHKKIYRIWKYYDIRCGILYAVRSNRFFTFVYCFGIQLKKFNNFYNSFNCHISNYIFDLFIVEIQKRN